MSYPTAYEMVHRKNRVRRRDAMHCMNLAAEILRDLLHGKYDTLELKLKAQDRIVDCLFNANRYNFEARINGHKLPG